ncbi:MAG: hypothetical protein HDS54_06710 [Barnesiella sp.]|nr:hypothetical protein [Barnesiella sp.]MBD5247836.1 hypothetical protein [Barnesiella sp.]
MSDETIIKAIGRLLPEGEEADGALSPAQVDALAERYPYFPLPAALLLRNDATLSEGERSRYAAMLARTATSPSVLAALLAEDEEPFYPDEKVTTPSTESAIDTFLSTYGNGPEDDEVLNRLIFNPTPDYAQMLAREEQHNLPDEPAAEPGSKDDLLNRFIIKQKRQEGSVPADEPQRIPATTVENRHSDDATTAPAPSDSSLLSESLAKIFIRQKQYERAFEIISQLSLKYPEKSVYFADQLRFLRKVINNRRHAAGKN